LHAPMWFGDTHLGENGVEAFKLIESEEDNLIKAAKGLYNNGARFLAILIVVWSGLGPHIKQLLITIGILCAKSWPLPYAYSWLEVLGRLAFLDEWIVAALAVFAHINHEVDIPVAGFTIHIMARTINEAILGLWIFLVVRSASQLLSFVVNFPYRSSSATCAALSDSSVCSARARLRDAACSSERALKFLTYGFCAMPLLVSLVQLLPVSHVYMRMDADPELPGFLVASKGEVQAKLHEVLVDESFSIVGVLQLILHRHANYVLAIAMLLFVMLAPVVRSTLIMILWLKPLNPRQQDRVLNCIALLTLFASLDVFAAALVISGQQAPFCFKNVAGIALHITILPGFCLLAAVAILENFTSYLFSRYFRASLDDIFEATSALPESVDQDVQTPRDATPRQLDDGRVEITPKDTFLPRAP